MRFGNDNSKKLAKFFHECRYNAHQIDFNYMKEGRSDIVETYCVGTALYPILPLLNHSCNANTIRFNIGNKVVLVASR